ncbi:MAG: hypothetical protein U1E52_00560 [Geminicoccaceae bacterium]
MASYADLIQGIGPNRDAAATHFISYGFGEGRTISFDALEYIASWRIT